MRLTLFAILFAFCAMSCSPKVVPTAVQNSHDTTIIERVVSFYDTTIVYLPPVEVESSTTRDSLSRLETSLAVSVAQTKNGTLNHTIYNKPDPIRIPAQLPATTIKTSYVATSFERVPVEVPAEWTRWEHFVQMVGYWALIWFVLSIIVRKLLKLLK